MPNELYILLIVPSLAWCYYFYTKRSIIYNFLTYLFNRNTFTISYSDNHAIFEYNLNGKKNKIFLPYNPRKKASINDITINWENHEEQINHPKGIPFLVTPESIGAKSIKVESLRQTKIYENNQLPVI